MREDEIAVAFMITGMLAGAVLLMFAMWIAT